MQMMMIAMRIAAITLAQARAAMKYALPFGP
jgi:hypothetical protein